MKNQKGISLITVIIIVIVVIIAMSIISKNAEIHRRKAIINDLNDAAATYNLDVLNKNKIIVKYYPNASSDLLYKEVKRIPLDTAKSENYDVLMEAYYSEYNAVMEYNDALLEYYRAILE